MDKEKLNAYRTTLCKRLSDWLKRTSGSITASEAAYMNGQESALETVIEELDGLLKD